MSGAADKVKGKADEVKGTVKEKVGDATGMVRTRVKGDLKRFKNFIEERGTETGGWRGEVHPGDQSRPDAL